MQDQIFRVRVSPSSSLRMRAQPNQRAEIIVLLSNRQAVVRLDESDYSGWYLVFADTPGEGLYIGYVSATHLVPIEAELAEMVDREITPPGESETEESVSSPLAEPVPETPVIVPIPDDDPRNIQLSEHFTLHELIWSNKANELGLSNLPSAEEYQVLIDTAQQMEAVRRLLNSKPIQVTSGFRNDDVNRAVGGVPNSAHRLGYAVDFVCPQFGTPYEICRAISESAIMENVDQLIQERNRWVHISFDPRRRGDVKSYFVKDGVKEYFSYLVETDPRLNA